MWHQMSGWVVVVDHRLVPMKIRKIQGTFVLQLLRPSWKGSGLERGVITKGVFSLEEAPESLKFIDSLESLENCRILLCFPQSGGSLEYLDSQESLNSL